MCAVRSPDEVGIPGTEPYTARRPAKNGVPISRDGPSRPFRPGLCRPRAPSRASHDSCFSLRRLPMARPSLPRHTLGALAALGALTLFVACQSDAPSPLAPDQSATSARAGYAQPGMHRQYGTPVKVGDGMARTYVVLDAKSGQAPAEIGIALDQKALDGLPADGMEYAYDLQLPAQA